MLLKISISNTNKCFSVELYIYQNVLGFHIIKLFSTMMIRNFLNIKSTLVWFSEWSCDNKAWSNGCWKISFDITWIILFLFLIHIEKNTSNCNDIPQYYCFYCIVDQINEALVTIRDFFQNKKLYYLQKDQSPAGHQGVEEEHLRNPPDSTGHVECRWCH